MHDNYALLKETYMPKRTYQPSKRRRARQHGFLARKQKGKKVVARRRRKKRARLVVST